jgi:hypothetical protein
MYSFWDVINWAEVYLPWRFVVDVEFVREFSHCENMGKCYRSSRGHTASVFRVEVSRMRA